MEWRLLGTGVELRLSSEPLLGDNPLHERQLRAAEAAGEFVLVDAGTFAEIEVDGDVHRIGGSSRSATRLGSAPIRRASSSRSPSASGSSATR